MIFKEVSAKEIKGNLISMISDEWMLISAGNQQSHNMMTASWGFMGEMWGKDTVIAAVRPTRHTFGFLENNDTFALCFMGDEREVHKICGSKSGRDIDKVKETGLTPIYSHGTMYFEEARLVIIAKKTYADTLKPECFIEKEADEKWYNNDYHKMFYGEILTVLEKQD